MTIPFVKAHGAGNDFLLIEELPEASYPDLARALCDRHRGLGADGLIVFTGPTRIRLFNSDGSEAELSGNGTRCAAAWLVDQGRASETLEIETMAGPKRLRLIERHGSRFVFEMSMGQPQYSRETLAISAGPSPVTILEVGNPQCALLVESLDFDWQALGREIEAHPRFPRRTNVSFSRIVDPHSIEARFWERGAGATLSSGTGSTGAACAAILSGRVESPVGVLTQSGALQVSWQPGQEALLNGPAEIVAVGQAFLSV